MVRRFHSVVWALFIVAIFGFPAWADPHIKPGQWEITTKTEMPGMPAQSVTHQQCISTNDLVPMSYDANQECKIEDIQYTGNTVLWKMTCGGQGGGMTGSGQVTYSGESMSGVMNMTIQPHGMQMKNTLSGHRIGECQGQ
jgi:hypothetical protein